MSKEITFDVSYETETELLRLRSILQVECDTEVFHRALTMLRILVKCREEGQTVVIKEQDGRIVQEIDYRGKVY